MQRSAPKRSGKREHDAGVAVRLEHIGKRYDGGAEVLRDVSATLDPGGFYFLTGAGGSGKTTLLDIICLAQRPNGGALRLFDTDTAGLDGRGRAMLRRRIGMVLQDFRLFEDLSVTDNVALPLRIAGTPEPEIREHVAAMLGWLDLERNAASLPTALSGIEKQRVAIARAIVGRPDLLLADEPTGHVDHEAASFLVRVFERVNALGTTVLIATRDTEFAARFTHPRLHLSEGMLRTDEPDAQ
jgi:cell division transport system ATP-binding protein